MLEPMEEVIRDACARLFPGLPDVAGNVIQLIHTYGHAFAPGREPVVLDHTDAVLMVDRERLKAIHALGEGGIDHLYQLLDEVWEGAFSMLHIGLFQDWYGLPLDDLSSEVLLLMSIPPALTDTDSDPESFLRALEDVMRGTTAGPQGLVCPPGVDDERLTLIRLIVHAADPAVLIIPGTGSSGMLRCTGRDPDPLLPDAQRARSMLADLSVDFARAGVPALMEADLFPDAVGNHPESLRGMVREGILTLIRARASDSAFAPGSMATQLAGDSHLVVVRRDGPEGSRMICLHNLSDDLVEFRDRRDNYPWPETGVVRDVLTEDLVFPTREGDLFSLEIEPWEVLWLRFGVDPT